MHVTQQQAPDTDEILIVEDDDEYAALLEEYLRREGFVTARCGRGDEAVRRIRACPPRLVILDVMLPGMDGLQVCRTVRDTFEGGILMLTALNGTGVEVEAFELGADDFVGKPVVPRALLARVRSLLRRVDPTGLDEVRRVGHLVLDRRARSVRLDGQLVRLTGTEQDVLWLLCKRPGEVVTRNELYRRVLGVEYDGLDRGMDVHVSRIRTKLQAVGLKPLAIKSVRGAGYVITQPKY